MIQPEPKNVNGSENWFCNPVVFSSFAFDVPCRSGHTVSRIENKLCFFGGYDGSDRVSTLECLYNIHAIGKDDDALSLRHINLPAQTARAGHVAFCHEKSILVYGGYNTERDVLSDVFTVAVDSWKYQPLLCQSKGIPLDRRWHCGSLQSNRLIVFGGWNKSGALSHTCYLDINSSTWNAFSGTSAAPPPRRWHTMESISSGGQLAMFGGYDAKTAPLSDLWLLDVAHERWTQIKPQPKSSRWPSPRCRHTFTRLGDEGTKRFLLIGGFGSDKDAPLTDMWIFHSDDHSWEPVLSARSMFACQRAGHSATYIPETNSVWVFGGFGQGTGMIADLQSIELG